ncbi:MAG: hypothetical protein COX30_01995 [Candidatus Moranbacteria bacterium CG23_combo_of_CG06-09_8_20_14_all_39_10]|nr:MAG: hypothetical protein COX30_01995 [Candidatus Moranbacteria bacterium CG23_combo_of_CG06-09_8_20_14_all_39_10]
MVIFSDEQLKLAAKMGEEGSARALTILSKRNVGVKTRNVKVVPYAQAMEVFSKVKEQSVVAYTQAMTGINGISVLSLERAEALRLVDLFNGRPNNTTKVMQELDRSTIRETLNILANSYATALVNNNDVAPIMLGSPSMITRMHLVAMAEKIEANAQDGERAVIFETALSVEDTDFKINLYFFFLAKNKEESGKANK